MIEHRIIKQDTKENGDPRDYCLCGAMWSHPKSRSLEERQSIYESHVKYFEKTLSTVL